MTDDTINVGDRVRLKGDIGPNPLWMTVLRTELNPTDEKGQRLAGTFMLLAIVTTNAGGGPDIKFQPGITTQAVTKEPHEPISGSMKLRRAR